MYFRFSVVLSPLWCVCCAVDVRPGDLLCRYFGAFFSLNGGGGGNNIVPPHDKSWHW